MTYRAVLMRTRFTIGTERALLAVTPRHQGDHADPNGWLPAGNHPLNWVYARSMSQSRGMSSADAAIARLFEILPTLSELAMRTVDTSRVGLVDHSLVQINLPSGLSPEQQGPALLRALIQLDHGPGRESQAKEDYERTLRLSEE